MAGYDTGTLTISSMNVNVAQDDILRLTAPASGAMNLNHMAAFNHDLNFDGGDLLYIIRFSPLASDPWLPR